MILSLREKKNVAKIIVIFVQVLLVSRTVHSWEQIQQTAIECVFGIQIFNLIFNFLQPFMSPRYGGPRGPGGIRMPPDQFNVSSMPLPTALLKPLKSYCHYLYI